MKKPRGLGNNTKSKEEHATIRKLYELGATQRQISSMLGFAHNTVGRHIMMFRDCIRCEHGIKRLDCRFCAAHRRKSMEELKRIAGV